ncbi:MAG TPA: hypothetical protein ENN17_09830 [bacterium]|nr:hypothetical protein [bacterium]
MKKLEQTQKFNWYTILWGGCLLIVLYLALTWQVDKKYVGIVERKDHVIRAQEPGRMNLLLVDIGDPVHAGQMLGMLDISDLKTSLGLLNRELSSIRKFEQANRSRLALEVRRMGLELENEAARLMDRLSLIESRSTELAGLNAEIERLSGARQAGLGHSRDLSALILQRDALASLLREQGKDLTRQTRKLQEARKSRDLLDATPLDSLTRSLFVEHMARAEEIERMTASIEHRMTLRTLFSPCEGYVTEILARQGNVVQDFDSVLCVEEIPPRYVDVYIPERSGIQPMNGMEAKIYSRRNRALNTTGLISFVHPGFVRADERLAFRGQMFWARKLRVELDEGHGLLPGEAVTVRIKVRDRRGLFLANPGPASAGTTEANGPDRIPPPLKKIQVPLSLREKSRFEPSGITWVPAKGKYLVVSDDTGLQDTPSEHAPFLHYMDESGHVEADPVPILGIDSVNDLEAVTALDSETFILVSSQNVSQKGKRPVSRERILKIRKEADRFVVLRSLDFLSLLLNSHSVRDLKALGLAAADSDGRPVLNIEGAAYFDGALFLGLKAPVSPDGAILWKLEDVDRAFETGKIAPGQLVLYGTVKLGKVGDNPAGISDLHVDGDGVMWALSAIPGAEPEEQTGGLHRIDRLADGRLAARRLLSFPGLKPEGLGLREERRAMIVFDRDQDVPLYAEVDLEALCDS